MVRTLSIIIVFMALSSCQKRAQVKFDGFMLLEEARSQIENNEETKALKTLENIESANFGFCGNSYIKGIGNGLMMKSGIYRNQKKYKKSLKVLNSINNCGFGADCDIRDSLKVENLFSIYGKDKVRKSFRTNKIERDTMDYDDYRVELKEINYQFTFYNSAYFYDNDSIPIDVSEINSLDTILRAQLFYKLLKE